MTLEQLRFRIEKIISANPESAEMECKIAYNWDDYVSELSDLSVGNIVDIFVFDEPDPYEIEPLTEDELSTWQPTIVDKYVVIQ